MSTETIIRDLNEGFVVFDNDGGWRCGLGDEDDVELALHVEITNMMDATGEPEFTEYPYLVSIGIITAVPHESFYEGTGDVDRLDLISDMVGYMGSIPIDHQLIATDALNHNITESLPCKDAKLVSRVHDYGTVAAQQGRGTRIICPQFKTEQAARNYALQLIELYGDTVMTLVGFTLDRPINMIGETGWSQIEKMHNGVK